MEITLTPDIEAALTEQARQQGIPPEQLALKSLRQQFVAVDRDKQREIPDETLADFLADSIGVLHSNEKLPDCVHR